jgi:hypothetical protein
MITQIGPRESLEILGQLRIERVTGVCERWI